jgi:hypothetical protein
MTLGYEEAAELVGQVAADLHHPTLVGLRCDASDVDNTIGQFDDEKDVVGDQPAQGPHFRGEEVRRHDAAPVRLEEHRPGRAPSSLGSRLHALALEDIGNGAAPDLMSQVIESALNTGVTPSGILQGHAHNEVTDDPHRARATGSAPVAEVTLPADQLSVPAQQRIRGDDRAEVEQNLPWNAESLAREQRPLPIGKAQRASLESFAQHARRRHLARLGARLRMVKNQTSHPQDARMHRFVTGGKRATSENRAGDNGSYKLQQSRPPIFCRLSGQDLLPPCSVIPHEFFGCHGKRARCVL